MPSGQIPKIEEEKAIMSYGKMLFHYQRTNIETSTELGLIVMCYEHAIRFLKQAKDHFKNQEYLQKAEALQQALDIINELKCSLDFEKGKQIATNLDSIYNFLIRTLLEADIRKNLKDFDNAISILHELKEVWERISRSNLEQETAHETLLQGEKNNITHMHASLSV